MRSSDSLIWHGIPMLPPPTRRATGNFSFLPRLRRDRETENLERHVSRLQAILLHYAEAAGRWTVFRRETTAAIAVLMLALGFMLGFYREPIQQAVINLTQVLGLATKVANADAAYAAYQRNKYATALQLARPLAAKGDPRAQSMLGLLYYRGRGVPQDDKEALKWFHRAADQDDVAAQFYLGVMYSEGQGVPQDHAEATKWFRRAADLGDAQAQYNLGLSYAKGEAGKPDYVTAHMWFNLAAAHFPASHTGHRSAAVNNRDVVARKMTVDQVAEAEKRAREWKPR